MLISDSASTPIYTDVEIALAGCIVLLRQLVVAQGIGTLLDPKANADSSDCKDGEAACSGRERPELVGRQRTLRYGIHDAIEAVLFELLIGKQLWTAVRQGRRTAEDVNI